MPKRGSGSRERINPGRSTAKDRKTRAQNEAKRRQSDRGDRKNR